MTASLRRRISKNVSTTKGSAKILAEPTVACGHTVGSGSHQKQFTVYTYMVVYQSQNQNIYLYKIGKSSLSLYTQSLSTTTGHVLLPCLDHEPWAIHKRRYGSLQGNLIWRELGAYILVSSLCCSLQVKGGITYDLRERSAALCMQFIKIFIPQLQTCRKT